MQERKKIKVGFSIGDLNGIGGELIVKTLCKKIMLESFIPVVYASSKTISFLSEYFDCSAMLNSITDLNDASEHKINIIDVWSEEINIQFGIKSEKSGYYSFLSLQAAVEDLKQDLIDILITAPIDKLNIQSEKFNFPGHTNYLEEELKGDSLMFMISDNLKVALLTDHIPINEVINSINPSLILNKFRTLEKTLIMDFGITTPRIAILGINPHAGDGGVVGAEDDLILKPTIKKLKVQGKKVLGPYSADSFFLNRNLKRFDAVLASYHDQGLIPFKTLAFGKGVNFTAGLNKIRTSPDHGTAYEIAGKGIANTDSFEECIFKGIEIFKQRKRYQKQKIDNKGNF